MKHLKVMGFAAAILCTVPSAFSSEWAHTAKDVNLRAGPAMEYPVVAQLRAGVSISVEGCLSDYRWCDVVAGPYRGWVYAGNIVYPYQGANVPVLNYGAMIGIGIVAFALGNYWDSYYRDRPWYPQRQHWIDRPRPHPGFGPAVPRPPGPGYRPGVLPRQPGPGLVPGGARPPQDARPGGGRPPQGASPDGVRPQGVRPQQSPGPWTGRPVQGAGSGAGVRRAPPEGHGPAGAHRP